MSNNATNGRTDDEKARLLAETLITKFGKPSFRKLIKMFERNETVVLIGDVYHVSKQRASQWRKTLGFTTTTFRPRSCVMKLLQPRR